jgi:hypothetical protein
LPVEWQNKLYIKKMRKRDKELSKGWGQFVTPLSVDTIGGYAAY